MNRFLIALVSAACFTTATAQTHWGDIQTIAQGRERGRTTFMTYDNRDIALENEYTRSKYMIPLNGSWKFIYAEDYREIPLQAVVSPTVDLAPWPDITVPGNMELQGYGTPVYSPGKYDFSTRDHTNRVLEDQIAAGVYKKRFEIPLLLFDRDIYLHLDGFRSAVDVYLNGQKVGYSENSGTPVEFRLNPYMIDGINDLTLIVYRHSTGSMLETQDSWRMSGLIGDAYVISQPKTHIADYRIRATVDSTEFKKGFLRLDFELSNSFNSDEEVTVYYDLLDPSGEMIYYYYTDVVIPANGIDTMRHLFTIPEVRKWSAETPDLYTVLFRIRKEGRFIEYIPVKVGFRNVDIAQGQFRINGEPVSIDGVVYNRHHSETGHAISRETIEKDIRDIRYGGFNAVRTLYPQAPFFYEMCDRYGLYVFDGANIDPQGAGTSLGKGGALVNNSLWLPRYLDRVQRLYESGRNYASVVAWSLGNDRVNGINAQEAYLYLKELDSLCRPIVFNGAANQWNTDVLFPVYTSRLDLEPYIADDRPLIFSAWESTAVPQSLRHPGGFFHLWTDDSRLAGQPSGTIRMALSAGDHEPTDQLRTLGAAYMPVLIEPVDLSKLSFRATNRQVEGNLSNYTIAYTLYGDGKTVRSGTLAASGAPGAERTLQVPAFTRKKGTKYHLVMTVTTKNATAHHAKGTTVLRKEYNLL